MDQCRKRPWSVVSTDQNSTVPPDRPDRPDTPAELWNPHFHYGRIMENEIRLVTLKQGVVGSQIECSLSSTTLPPPYPYHALSYCWGEQRQQKRVLFNSQPFMISEELHAALSCLRRPSMDLTIWVDYLCISQSNPEEKQHQVDLMHEIYGQAEKVISWLGEGSNDLVDKLSEHKENLLLVYCSVDPANCLQNLFSRKYWSRAWIIQEMRSSRPGCLKLRCGMGEESYDSVLKAAGELCSMLDIHLDMSGTQQTLYTPAVIPERNRTILPPDGGRNQLSFREFLDMFLDRECSDPRDNLFAFKHLFENRLQGRIMINYEEDKEVVIPRIFAGLIEETQDLYILTIRTRQISGRTEWQKRLPSWCPFVGTPYKTPCIPKLPDQISGVGQRGAKISFVDHGSRLALKTDGTVLGRVLKVHHPTCLPEPFQKFQDDSDAESASNQISEYREFLRSFHIDGFPELPCQSMATSRSAYGAVDGRRKFSRKRTSDLEDFARRVTGRSICVFERRRRTKRFNWGKRAKGQKKAYRNIASAYVTNEAQKGDLICLLSGHQMIPVVLRREGEIYRVIGDVSGRFTDHVRGYKKREFLIC